MVTLPKPFPPFDVLAVPSRRLRMARGEVVDDQQERDKRAHPYQDQLR